MRLFMDREGYEGHEGYEGDVPRAHMSLGKSARGRITSERHNLHSTQ